MGRMTHRSTCSEEEILASNAAESIVSSTKVARRWTSIRHYKSAESAEW
jgi:hypothetical protein